MFEVDPKIGSKYRFVNICAQRTRQLFQGAEPRVKLSSENVPFLAMREVLAGKVQWRFKGEEEPGYQGVDKKEDVSVEDNP